MKILITESQYNILLEKINEESILIVGDSHTVDVGWTWSSLLKKNYENVTIKAIGGKRTSWMKEQLIDALSKKHYDIVIIWGGNNDIFSLVSNNQVIKNIQDMVDMVNKQGGKAYVIQGYDYEVFADPDKYKPTKYADKEDMKKYRLKYMDFQNSLADLIDGAVIIPKFNLDNSYTKDNAHGNQAAHKYVYDKVVSYLESGPTVSKSSVYGKSEEPIDDEKDLLGSLKTLLDLQSYANQGLEFEAHERPIPVEEEVFDIQEALQFLGFSLPVWGVDGKFGPETRKAVTDFQASVGLEETGRIEKNDLEKMISELKNKNFESFDISKLVKQKTESLKTVTPGESITIEDPSVKLTKYPSDLKIGRAHV